jgi:hypothetical protein
VVGVWGRWVRTVGVHFVAIRKPVVVAVRVEGVEPDYRLGISSLAASTDAASKAAAAPPPMA